MQEITKNIYIETHANVVKLPGMLFLVGPKDMTLENVIALGENISTMFTQKNGSYVHMVAVAHSEIADLPDTLVRNIGKHPGQPMGCIALNLDAGAFEQADRAFTEIGYGFSVIDIAEKGKNRNENASLSPVFAVLDYDKVIGGDIYETASLVVNIRRAAIRQPFIIINESDQMSIAKRLAVLPSDAPVVVWMEEENALGKGAEEFMEQPATDADETIVAVSSMQMLTALAPALDQRKEHLRVLCRNTNVEKVKEALKRGSMDEAMVNTVVYLLSDNGASTQGMPQEQVIYV